MSSKSNGLVEGIGTPGTRNEVLVDRQRASVVPSASSPSQGLGLAPKSQLLEVSKVSLLETLRQFGLRPVIVDPVTDVPVTGDRGVKPQARLPGSPSAFFVT